MTNAQLTRQRAVLSVILGAPPAAVAADLGCDISTLMGWVRAQRQQLLKASRAAAPEAAPAGDPADMDDDHAGDDHADDPAVPTRLNLRCTGKRLLPNDRRVAPENSALVDAAYRHAEFDYSGRRVRPNRLTH
jgi:transposase-like protein